MGNIKYKFTFSDEDMQLIHKALNNSPYSSKQNLRARVLLALEEASRIPMTSAEIAKNCGTTVTTVQNIRTKYATEGLSGALYYKKNEKPSRQAIIDEDFEGKLLSLIKSEPPDGKTRWSARTLAAECIRLHYVDKISYQTIVRFLNNHDITL